MLIQFVGEYSEANRSSKASRLKFVMTTRPYSSIERSFRRYLTKLNYIFLDALLESEKISSEINSVIEYMVPRIAQAFSHPLKPDVQQELMSYLKSVQNRTYLWLHLIFEVIKDTHQSKAERLKNEIDHLPASVNAVYERILNRGDTSYRGEAFRLLQIIVGARVPMGTKELNIVFRIQDNQDHGKSCKYIADLDLDDDRPFEEFVRNRCGLLVTFDNGVVHLLHQTVSDFLLRENTSDTTTGPLGDTRFWNWRRSIVAEESDYLLANVSMTYLLFTVFDYYDWREKSRSEPLDKYSPSAKCS